jgi:hypothetical protein
MAKTLAVDEVLSRVQELTQDLKQMRGEICNQIFPLEEPHGPSLFAKGGEGVEIMAHFKAAIDDVRHVAWVYLEAMANRPAFEADPQRKLLARATEILGALSQNPPLPKTSLPLGEHSLLDRLLQLIDNRIDPKILERKKLLHKHGS